MRKNITANGTSVLTITGRDINNLYLFNSSASDLGGGTLTISIRDRDTSDTLIAIDTLIAGDQGQYPVGGDVEVSYTLAGATSPDIDLLISQGR